MYWPVDDDGGTSELQQGGGKQVDLLLEVDGGMSDPHHEGCNDKYGLADSDDVEMSHLLSAAGWDARMCLD